MDPRQLATNLLELGVPGADPADPETALAAVEAAADRDPADRRLSRAIVWLADRVRIEATHPPVIANVRRRALLRWDSVSTVWAGVDEGTGAPMVVRVVRPELSDRSVWHRWLIRDGRALGAVAPVEIVDGGPGEPPALR
ncbi:MAG: hypothetical protein ABMB14_33365, partial [Myxococcota bacterium]